MKVKSNNQPKTTVRRTSNIQNVTGSDPLLPPRGGRGSPSVSVPAVPREFWVSLDPVKNQYKAKAKAKPKPTRIKNE